jgi:hypothetical protein
LRNGTRRVSLFPTRTSGQKKLVRQKEKAKEERSDAVAAEKDISTVVLYEKNIDIVDSESRRKLAKGIAYLNKSGQIVRIKIVNTR